MQSPWKSAHFGADYVSIEAESSSGFSAQVWVKTLAFRFFPGQVNESLLLQFSLSWNWAVDGAWAGLLGALVSRP